MQKFELGVSYIVSSFGYHAEIKETLLGLIDKAEAVNITDNANNVYISRTDWLIKNSAKRKYFEHIRPLIQEHITEVMSALNHDNFTIGSHWFQQYSTSDTHNWHQHRGASWSNIYYVELPNDAPRTMFKQPTDMNNVFVPDVKEGDILTMPGFVWHSSQPNMSKQRKTVCVFNIR